MTEPATDDNRQACFLKSLITVFKNNRDVLSSLPDILEQCLGKEAQVPNLTETEKVGDNRKEDLERLETRKREDMGKQLESLQGDIDMKTQRVAALDRTIKDKTATIEAMKSEQSTVMFTKDRKLTERELKKRDKLLVEESEKQVKMLQEENMKLKNELEKKEKEKSETARLQEEKILTVTKESDTRFKEISNAAQAVKERNDSLINELAAKDKVYTKNLSKMNDDLSNAHAKMDLYKSRLASLSEKRVKQDQRLVEDTLGSNRQSELERDFSAFFDDDRLDACEKMQAIYHNKEDNYIFFYYPRLACIIFETAYEQVKEAKEAASDLFKELIKVMIDQAPQMGQDFSITRKSCRKEQGYSTCTFPIAVSLWGDGAYYSKDIMDGMMLSLKEFAHTCNLDYFVNSVATIAFEKWKKWSSEDESCIFTPASHLIQDLDKYIKACIRLNWRMVTQVPPMKLEFHCSTLKKEIHKKLGYHNSLKMRSRTKCPSDRDQVEEIACYLWPGLQDGGGRLIRAGEVICKVEKE